MMIKQTIFWQGFFCYALTRDVVLGAASKTTPISASTLPPLAGVNLAGLDFGATNDGQYHANAVVPPTTQIDHYLKQGVNLFRLPVAWPFLQPDMNAPLNQTSLAIYKQLVKNVTSKGAYAMIDIHAYARLKGQIVGQSTSTPANALVSLWTQLAKEFLNEPMVIFGLMNEPHDVVIETWAKTLQTVVTAVRGAGAPNIMTIPGTDYTALKSFPEWYKVMKTVNNGDGTFDGLVIEVHRYLDEDNSGTHTECTASHADEVKSAAEMLKADKRQAILAETGGGSTQSCQQFLPEMVGAISSNFPQWIGFAIWSAGAFDEKYELAIVVKDATSPTGWKDQPNWLSIQKSLPKANVAASKTIKKGGGAIPQTTGKVTPQTTNAGVPSTQGESGGGKSGDGEKGSKSQTGNGETGKGGVKGGSCKRKRIRV